MGLLLQAAGYFLVWLGPLEHRNWLRADGVNLQPPWLGWTIAAATLAIAASSVGLVIWSARRLGKQWSLEARVVEGHVLIVDGPYGWVRNPIYTGMLGMLVATGLATAHWWLLAAAIVLFVAGTYIRIRSEERLLREAFGGRFEEYVRKVPALLPGIY
jgi:protein-S-isoprenylcysteine O-methyltransferase Ste14